MTTNVSLFQNREIRRRWDAEAECWYFSIVDVVAVLTDSTDPRKYWNKLKERLLAEGNETVTNCHQLKMQAADGKMRLTDVADTETLLRLIQSVPSPKAEPMKLWLAKVGYERMQEMADPARSVDRAREYWKAHGRSDKWIQQRMMGQETRNKLTDYWGTHDVKEGREYAILTNLIHREWSDVSVKRHKAIKGLKTQNLRDHMSEAELIFTALAKLSTREIAESTEAKGLDENAVAGKKGGGIAKKARRELEEKTGKKVVSAENYLPMQKRLPPPEKKK